jgi:hypothetical protein
MAGTPIFSKDCHIVIVAVDNVPSSTNNITKSTDVVCIFPHTQHLVTPHINYSNAMHVWVTYAFPPQKGKWYTRCLDNYEITNV